MNRLIVWIEIVVLRLIQINDNVVGKPYSKENYWIPMFWQKMIVYRFYSIKKCVVRILKD